MLLVIAIIALIAGVIWLRWDEFSSAGMLLAILGGLATAIMFFVIAVNYIGVEADVASSKARYESLKYQYENNFYDNDNDVGKYELVRDIREWNEDLARNKKLQHNFWIGVLIPDVFDQFEYIEIGE